MMAWDSSLSKPPAFDVYSQKALGYRYGFMYSSLGFDLSLIQRLIIKLESALDYCRAVLMVHVGRSVSVGRTVSLVKSINRTRPVRKVIPVDVLRSVSRTHKLNSVEHM